MLSRLSIRDIVLIDRLDIDFAAGLAVLTGETGAGKSILLDAFALALGARGDQTLVRQGLEQGQVIAVFEVARAHPARALLKANDIAGRGRTDPAPRPVRRWPHPRLRQRPAGERAGDEAARHRAGRDPRPARRPRAGRCRHPSPPARRLWRASSATRPRSRALWEARRAAQAAADEPSRRGRARQARKRLAAPRGRRTRQALARRPARRPRSPSAAPS